MARTNPRTLAALAITASHAIDALAATIDIEPAIRTALALVGRSARGEKGLKRALAAMRLEVDALAEAKRDWKTPARKNYHWTVDAIGTLTLMAATGADHAALVLTHLGYGLAGEEPRADRIAAWQAAALAATHTLSAAAQPKQVNATKAAAEAKHLARIAKALGKHHALLAKTGARHHAKRVGGRAALSALLKRKRYPVHARVLAFDAAFGGLMIPDAGAQDDWFETDLATHVGAFACLKLGGHADPRGDRDDLVPIAYTPSDGIVYLDRAGAAYFQDTIEDLVPGRFASDGAAAVVKLLRASLG